jgi:hypothetical protein
MNLPHLLHAVFKFRGEDAPNLDEEKNGRLNDIDADS